MQSSQFMFVLTASIVTAAIIGLENSMIYQTCRTHGRSFRRDIMWHIIIFNGCHLVLVTRQPIERQL